jgi:DNA-binding NarL/FixJ family response regulator
MSLKIIYARLANLSVQLAQVAAAVQRAEQEQEKTRSGLGTPTNVSNISAMMNEKRLSPRLREVLDLLLQGLGEKQVAHQMGLSGHTIHYYIKDLYKRFGVSARSELLVLVLNGPSPAEAKLSTSTLPPNVPRPARLAVMRRPLRVAGTRTPG